MGNAHSVSRPISSPLAGGPPALLAPRVEEELVGVAMPPPEGLSPEAAAQIILSFDVEEHDRIEAAVGLEIDAALKAHYCERLDSSTRWLLDELGRQDIKATFFIVGQVARHNPGLVRAIHRA